MVETLAETDRCEDGEINGKAQTKKGRCYWLSAQGQRGEKRDKYLYNTGRHLIL